jgi:DnaJ-class molecular chaperone
MVKSSGDQRTMDYPNCPTDRTCSRCYGRGWLPTARGILGWLFSKRASCPECDGQGETREFRAWMDDPSVPPTLKRPTSTAYC